MKIRSVIIIQLFFSILISALPALESPSSDGSVALLDNPVFRIPQMRKLPKMDGVLSEGEWSDASALSGFWSTNTEPRQRPLNEYLAPPELQSQVYAGFTKEYLYVLYKMSHYPREAWLKADGRFPDVMGHPLYGIYRDDHLEFELRPHHDLKKGFRWGFYKWMVNSIGVMGDNHHSIKHGSGRVWQSKAIVKSGKTPDKKFWFVEMKIPFNSFRHWDYTGKTKEGRDIVQLPPPDGTTYRVWFKNGISSGAYDVIFDQHGWRATKTKMILDSKAVSFQIRELGPVMNDVVDVTLSLKNHNDKSESVRLGFFIENAEGMIFSSYESSATEGGLVEMRPGEEKVIRFKKKFPGISGDGNWLWFDVRSSGSPAKVLFQNRLCKFHASEGAPPPNHRWREKKLGRVERMRPPRKDFTFQYQYSPYKNRISAHVDIGLHSASDEAKSAKEAILTVLRDDDDEEEVASKKVSFKGEFATFLFDLPKDLRMGMYKVSLLLFDGEGQIVGERNPMSFYRGKFVWEKNRIGLEDVVWAPYTPIAYKDRRLDTLKVRHQVGESGLPEQIFIKADSRELPLENRANPSKVSNTILQRIGRGDQLRAPMRLEVMSGGQRHVAKPIQPTKITKHWKSEVEFQVELAAGPLSVTLKPQYDCDGAVFFKLKYGSKSPVKVDGMELVMDVQGAVDMRVGGYYGMRPVSGNDLTLPPGEGVLWDSAKEEHFAQIPLYYSRFVPYMNFGNGDRSFTWVCDSDRGWMIDREGSTMTLERDRAGDVTFRVKFINHSVEVKGFRDIDFVLITHPTKNRESMYRNVQWLYWRPEAYAGDGYECMPNDAPWAISGNDESYAKFKKVYPNGGPRLYINTWINKGQPEIRKNAYTGEWLYNSSLQPDMTPVDSQGGYGQRWSGYSHKYYNLNWGTPSFNDYYVYHLERQIRLGGVTGWWWDDMAIPKRRESIAAGGAYFRDPKKVGAKELPWQSQFGTINNILMMKRLARVFKKNDVPNYTSHWATSHADLFESYASASELVESAAAYPLGYEIDNITRYPISMFRFAAGTSRSLNVRIKPHHDGKGFSNMPGDIVTHDRGVLGRCLIHDIGADNSMAHKGEYLKLVETMRQFGFFDDDTEMEMIPYWRSDRYLRMGEKQEEEGFALTKNNPFERVYITVYRRPFIAKSGKKGYKALFVILNESDEDVRGRLHLLDSPSLFGGKNNIGASYMLKDLQAPPHFRLHDPVERKALYDVERKTVVTKSVKGARRKQVASETYGPVVIQAHNFRLLYGHFNPDVNLEKHYSKVNEVYRDTREHMKKGPWWKHWDKTLKR